MAHDVQPFEHNIKHLMVNKAATGSDASKLPVTSRRLSSIRPARDLTLGGVPKKTFTPVIPSRNNERATKSANASNTSPPKKKSLRKRPRCPKRHTFNENTRTLPIQLPLSRCRKGKEKSILVKQEDSATKSKLTDDITPAQILVKESTKCDNGSLLLIQLPDMLPLIAQASPSEDTTEENKTNLSSLRNAKDGLIGKLQIHRSGKTSLVIGNIPYKLRSGTRCDFLQDLASIKAMENDGYVINLGPIKHRLVCTPDVEKLLKSLP
ncbi:expressed hypothetical protein [Trichoplax adhaerens]|uniref:DNA-directed RNA polymerase III subunit RPC4 n=1 Tax=Trichoplax adhaerens TaxID=10228 RepID=B3S5D5_TRIAD|nr:expressed hypothetical protein [Trichoplax adhaerens]EDV22244.1 expressed hypothetical protein [Trichoplax adhaerens]|eukprot:XP_002115399.1 expressed hypothetical protein [Trichoplax adhaerens]